jgi:hypothetical protein
VNDESEYVWKKVAMDFLEVEYHSTVCLERPRKIIKISGRIAEFLKEIQRLNLQNMKTDN